MLGRGREVRPARVNVAMASPLAPATKPSRNRPPRLCRKVNSAARRRCSRGRLVRANVRTTTLRMSTTTCTSATSGAGSSTIMTATLRPEAPNARIALKSRRRKMVRPAAAVANSRVKTRRIASSSRMNGGSAAGSGKRPNRKVKAIRPSSMTARYRRSCPDWVRVAQ